MTRRLLSFVAVAVFASAVAGQDPTDLLKYFPAPANSVCVVNVGQLISSPRAVKGGWDKIEHTEYLAGAIPVHPNVQRLVSMSEFAPSHPGHGESVTVSTTKTPVDLARVATLFGTEVTSAGGEASVVVANTSTNLDVTSGQGEFDNVDNAFVGLSFSVGPLILG